MAQEVSSRAPAPRTRTDRTNILLVDDRPDGLLALSASLEMLGQNIFTARSGPEALRQALARDFAVILLDVSMPGMDGFETAALIRQRPRSKDTPIIFLTAALKNEAHIFKGYASGGVDYILKPAVPDILRSKVSIFVELARKTDELQALNERLTAQAEALSEANRELEAFSYSVSHDLRAPLRNLDGFSQMIARLYGDKLDERGHELIARLQASADRMSRIIDDLLTLSRVSRHDLDLRHVDLGAISAAALARLRLAEPQRKVETRIAGGLEVLGDPGLLTLLLENLIGNAWKFTSKRDDAVVEVGSVTRPGQRLFFVKDNGAGFDPKHADRLFAPFQRLHRASEFPGTGVGLATCRRIVSRHGGKIWAEGEPGKGAAFFFSIGARP